MSDTSHELFTTPPEISIGWINQEHLDTFAYHIGRDRRTSIELSYLLRIDENRIPLGLVLRSFELPNPIHRRYAYQFELESFLAADFDTPQRLVDLGNNRRTFLATYQAWLRQASAPS